MRIDRQTDQVQSIDSKPTLRNLNTHSIARIFIDRSSCLWVCTFGGGVNYCDLNEKLFYTLQRDPEMTNTLSGSHIRSVLEEGDDLWIGTSTNGLNRYNLKTQQFEYFNTKNSPVKLKSDKITALTLDDEQNLWVGSISGIEILRQGSRQLWKPPGYDQFPTYAIGTLAKEQIKAYAGDYEVFNDVECVEIDNAGNIWMGGNGLECLNPTTGKLVKYDKNDGLQGNSFKVSSSYKGADGRLCFGGINGLNYFYPDQIKANDIDAQPILTDISINNQAPQYGAATKDAIPDTISFAPQIKLSYLPRGHSSV